MVISRRALALLLFAVLAPLFFLVPRGGGSTAEAIDTPVLASPNVELITSRPGTAAISGEFSASAPYFYTSGLDSISVFDVSDPKNPKLTGKLANLVFENEAMSYGERRDASGKVVKRFVLVGVDLFQVSPGADRTSISRNIGGQQVIVVDVTDPANPQIAGKTPGSAAQGGVTTSSHTVQCLSLACDYAYTAGDGPDDPTTKELEGGFSIIDLRDLSAPKQVKTASSPAGDVNPVFTGGGGHYWDVDDAGIAWNTGAGGTAAFDISDPLNPKVLGGTDPAGAKTPLNDFIQHNSMRPNARSFKPGTTPSLANGNVALVTEEDYASEGDEVVCNRSGTFQTWSVPDLDGDKYRAGNPLNKTGKGTMRNLDALQAPDEAGGGLSTPVGGFCSAHWFDYHQGGIVAQGWYQQGMRLIDARDPSNIKQFGFFTGGATQVWDAYFVPARNADGSVKANREKTNIVYTADLVRGVDVFEIKDLPTPVAVSAPTTSAQDPLAPPQPVSPAAAPAPPAANGSAPAPAPATTTAKPGAKLACGAPTSRFAKASTLRLAGARLSGTAAPGTGCTLKSVGVAIGRKVGDGCRFLQAGGRFGSPRSCLRTQYLPAKGLARWTLATGKLPRAPTSCGRAPRTRPEPSNARRRRATSCSGRSAASSHG